MQKDAILDSAMASFNLLLLLLLLLLLAGPPCNAQTTPAKSLDVILQEYAFRAFVRPRTGDVYDAQPPSNLTGVEISVIRLRSGSLRNRGVRSYKEFGIPTGVVVQPYVTRMVFVYQNLRNWSKVYYPLPPGYEYLTPLLGLLAYNAANLSGTNLRELDVVASGSPISINFKGVGAVPSGSIAQCVWFDLDGLPEFRDLVATGVCSTYRQGHFAIVANSSGLAPGPAPSGTPPPGKRHKSESRVWKIVGGVVGGFVLLVLLSLLLVCCIRYMQNKKVAEMERQAEAGEALQMSHVGNTQAPVALGTRTQPTLENEYVA